MIVEKVGRDPVLEKLKLPGRIVVTSASPIKVDAVKKALRDFFPLLSFDVTGVKAESRVNEQPLVKPTDRPEEDEAFTGAKGRIASAEGILAGKGDTVERAVISIENGLFLEGGEYVDRAVAVVKLPNNEKTYRATSRLGIVFFDDAVQATLRKEGGFRDHTVGSVLVEMYPDIVKNKQDPHAGISAARPDMIRGGTEPFTREEQMIQALHDALLKAARAQ